MLLLQEELQLKQERLLTQVRESRSLFLPDVSLCLSKLALWCHIMPGEARMGVCCVMLICRELQADFVHDFVAFFFVMCNLQVLWKFRVIFKKYNIKKV